MFLVAHEVELIFKVVLERRVFFKEWGYFLTAEQKDTLDVEIGLVAEHEHAAVAELVILRVDTLHETLEVIHELPLNRTLIAVPVVLEVPECVAIVEAR